MMPVEIGEGRFRIGPPSEPVNLRMQVGLCSFSSPDAALLVSLLPAMIVARGAPRLALLLQLVGDETRHARPGRELVLERLLEVLLIEALRFGADVTSVPSVARGLSDERLVSARDAWLACAWLDGCRSCRRSGHVAFGFLCALSSRRRAASDGILAGVAHGAGQAPVALA
jgi:hypothetical protein